MGTRTPGAGPSSADGASAAVATGDDTRNRVEELSYGKSSVTYGADYSADGTSAGRAWADG